MYDMYIYKQDNPCWLSIIDKEEYYESYIKHLMTNAGFYFDDDFNNAYNNLEFFCNEYKKSIINCDYLMNWNFLNQFSLNILNEKKIDLKNNIKFFDYDENNYIYDFFNCDYFSIYFIMKKLVK